MAKIDYKAVSEAANRDALLAALGIDVDGGGKALCPFHDDARPSMQIYRDGYHCFACGAHGDWIDLAMQLKGLSRRDAARYVAFVSGQRMIETTLADADARLAARRAEREQFEADMDRLQELEIDIAEAERTCYTTEAWSAMWADAWHRLDKLRLEREIVDGRILDAITRRLAKRGTGKYSG